MARILLCYQSVQKIPKRRGSYMKKRVYSLKAKPKESFPVDDKKYQGLCSCCKFALVCTFNRNPGHNVLQCEEFDGIVYAPDQRNKLKNILPLKFTINPIPLRTPSQYFMGLCTTCEERTTCTYPKPEGGVWHCEEFR